MLHLDAYERDYIIDRGWTIRADGMIILTAEQARKASLGQSIRHPGKHTLTLPSIHGLTLIFEGMHFIVTA